jgi:hypothetical protein
VATLFGPMRPASRRVMAPIMHWRTYSMSSILSVSHSPRSTRAVTIYLDLPPSRHEPQSMPATRRDGFSQLSRQCVTGCTQEPGLSRSSSIVEGSIYIESKKPKLLALPTDVIREILLWVDVPHLLRCSEVSPQHIGKPSNQAVRSYMGQAHCTGYDIYAICFLSVLLLFNWTFVSGRGSCVPFFVCFFGRAVRPVCITWYQFCSDLAPSVQTCKPIHAMITKTSELRYKIELFASCMRDGQASALSSGERLERLHAHRVAWRSFRPQGVGQYPQPNYCHAYDYVSGFFVKCVAPNSTEASRVGSSLYTFTDVRKSVSDATRSVTLDVHTKDFAADPSQDLFSVLEMFEALSAGRSSGDIRIHLRSFSNPHEPHVEAKVPVLEESHGSVVNECLLEIADDALALFVTSETQSIFIWNWRNGQPLVVSYYSSYAED